jgi:hypothetical protein
VKAHTFPKEEPVKYALLIYSKFTDDDFQRLSDDEKDALLDEYLAISRSPGVIGAEQLQPVGAATTVRVDNGETLLSDGPYIEAKEHIGGLLLLDAENLDAAIAIAARIPAARRGAVEVRPILER